MSLVVVLNSVLSKGVESMNQPLSLASESIRILPPMGRPRESYSVIWASASCPVGRSVKEKVMLKVGSNKVDQELSGLSLYVLVDVGIEL